MQSVVCAKWTKQTFSSVTEKKLAYPTLVLGGPAPYRGSVGPFGPEMPKSLKNVSRGLRPGAPKKSPKSFGDSPKTLSRHFPETLRRLPTLSRDFLETFSGPLAGGPGRHFRDFFSISGPKAVRGGLVPKTQIQTKSLLKIFL